MKDWRTIRREYFNTHDWYYLTIRFNVATSVLPKNSKRKNKKIDDIYALQHLYINVLSKIAKHFNFQLFICHIHLNSSLLNLSPRLGLDRLNLQSWGCEWHDSMHVWCVSSLPKPIPVQTAMCLSETSARFNKNVNSIKESYQNDKSFWSSDNSP